MAQGKIEQTSKRSLEITTASAEVPIQGFFKELRCDFKVIICVLRGSEGVAVAAVRIQKYVVAIFIGIFLGAQKQHVL